MQGREVVKLLFLFREPSSMAQPTGLIKRNTTFLEGRLGLTHRRPSYRPTGTRPSPRSVSVWRSEIRPSSLLSTSRPTLCTHWSLTTPTSLGRDTWKKLIGSQASLQLKCNKEGFNAVGGHSKARIGILGNEINDCKTCDSRIGFGTGGSPDKSNSCGNAATHGGDNGNKFLRAMGYVLVQ